MLAQCVWFALGAPKPHNPARPPIDRQFFRPMLHLREHGRRDPVRHPFVEQRMLRTLPDIKESLYNRVASWIATWDTRGYPGRTRIMRSVIGYRRTYSTTRKWGLGLSQIPAWAAGMLAEHIEARCELGLALARELREHQAAMEAVPHHLSAAGRMAHARAARRPGSAMGARAKQLPVVREEKSTPE